MRAQLRAQWMFSVIITSTERSKSFENLHFQLNSVPQCAKWSWYLSSMRTTQLRAHKMFLVDNYIHWKVEVGRKSTFREQQCITYLFKMGIYTALATGLQLQAMSLHWPRCWLGTQHVARACVKSCRAAYGGLHFGISCLDCFSCNVHQITTLAIFCCSARPPGCYLLIIPFCLKVTDPIKSGFAIKGWERIPLCHYIFPSVHQIRHRIPLKRNKCQVVSRA
jgi:hypothetical protein